jgi:hypothetical protein
MRQEINQPVDVLAWCNAQTRKILPYRIRWKGKEYQVKEVGYPHVKRCGRVLFYEVGVDVGSVDFCLEFNTEERVWILKTISDGIAD